MEPPTITGAQGSIWSRIARWWKERFRGQSLSAPRERLKIKIAYGRFREILNLNDSLLRLFADIQEKASGRSAFALGLLIARIRQGLMDAFVLAKDLNQLANARYPELYDLLQRLDSELRDVERLSWDFPDGPLVLPLDGLHSRARKLAGSKMACLGEIASIGLSIPAGFVATTVAFHAFMNHNALVNPASELDSVYESRGYDTLERAAGQVVQGIIEGDLPPCLEDALSEAYERLSGGVPVALAVRSSAVGEDTAWATHAGQYLTLLHVRQEGLTEAYRRVLASAFTPQAVIYRYQHGLTCHEAGMAVGFLKMLTPRVSGVMFTRDYQDPGRERLRLSVVQGVADNLVSGRVGAGEFVLDPDGADSTDQSWFQPGELSTLASAGKILEKHFGTPQDIEWALDEGGLLSVLQSRPMVLLDSPSDDAADMIEGEVLISGGQIGCPGCGCGIVVKVSPERNLPEIADGTVLVMQQASPSYAYLFPKCAAVVAESGSPSCHLAILCREAGVPALVGLAGASSRLGEGQPVFVHAQSRKVYSAKPGMRATRIQPPSRLAQSPAVAQLRRIGCRITPLNLTDPSLVTFRAERCQTLHDLVRFVHEKLYAAMFGFGEQAARSSVRSWKLEVKLPLTILVADLGGGLVEEPSQGEQLLERHIASTPFQAFLAGLLDSRIDWRKPRNVSGSGFMSVMGEAMLAAPAEAQDLEQPSFAVLARQYMNFSARAGYHFAVIEAICSAVENKNYIQYRFGGGGAGEERRLRRAAFLWQVLSSLGFNVQVNSDLVTARYLKLSEPDTLRLLRNLGQLTLCSRQLDMLMDSDDAPRVYAAGFLDNRFEQF